MTRRALTTDRRRVSRARNPSKGEWSSIRGRWILYKRASTTQRNARPHLAHARQHDYCSNVTYWCQVPCTWLRHGMVLFNTCIDGAWCVVRGACCAAVLCCVFAVRAAVVCTGIHHRRVCQEKVPRRKGITKLVPATL